MNLFSDVQFMLLLFYFVHGISGRYVIRKTEYGKIRGFITRRAASVSVEQYLGVPYVSPPVGNLRFEYPQKPKPWRNILDTLVIPPACPQPTLSFIQQYAPGFNRTDEDCLYINVYVPRTTKKEKLPVFLHIHGGSNEVGMGAMFDGDVLAANGQIIVVTFNYRLAIFGFVAAKSEGLEGNYGFLDQVEAMKWVKSNIRYFNGNPDRVTIHGHSAGAVDVGLHMVSSLSHCLFQNAIMHSGSPFVFWANQRSDAKPGYNIDLEKFKDICPKSKFESLKECLKSVPAEELATILGNPSIENLIIYSFPIIIDGKFLKQRPENYYKNGRFSGKSFLFSFTDAEWAEVVHNFRWLNYSDTTLGRFMRNNLENLKVAYPGVTTLTDLIFREYNLRDDLRNTIPSLSKYVQVESDFLFVAPMIELADLMAQWTNKIYISSFDQPIEWTDVPSSLGPSHGRDLFYLFGTPLVGHSLHNFTQTDKHISRKIMKLYSNFAIYGILTLDGETQFSPYVQSTKIVNSLKREPYRRNFVKGISNFKVKKMQFWNQCLPCLSKRSTCMACI